MLVQVKKSENDTAFDIEFDFKHSKSHTHLQHLICFKSQIRTVCFNDQLFLYQTEKKSVQEDHSTTNAIKNDLAEMLLRFFVSWNELSSLFWQYAPEYDSKQNVYFKIWIIVESTLSLHNCNFAQNFDLLQKSREDAKVDAALREFMDSFDYDIDVDTESIDIDIDINDLVVHEQQSALQFSSETLILAYHFIISY